MYEYPKPQKSVPLWEVIIKATVTAQVMLTAILGNTLIVMVVLWNKSLRTTTNFFIVNLAISDILVTVSCTWVHLVKDLTEGWILGVFFCKFNSFVQVVSTVTSILSMVLIACDRFFGIVFAMKAHIIERRARNSLIFVWIISIAVGMPMLFFRKLYSRQWKNHNEQWCDDDWPSEHFHTYRRAYWTFITVVLFFLPIVVMGGAYFGIIKTLWTAQAPGERLAKDVNIQIKVKRKVVMMLVTILAVFGICWFPVQFSILYSEYKTEKSEKLEEWYEDFTFFAYFFALSNSAINPIIYTAFNENFRKEVIQHSHKHIHVYFYQQFYMIPIAFLYTLRNDNLGPPKV
ncbi:hypothetical protein KUTeg_004233 [Tegillarca granosa]|uniref:G-protein coupled receptors family 1 profile domain-containing protein n=1 Tax=Tegillarca granosa TaxID=220873 RepID=A0ABQ9FR54_TEGGR|nr:hypothetical protein KUTeg_004233 [Tegillarca granosa]